MQYIRYSIYPKSKNSDVKEIKILSSDEVYSMFGEMLQDPKGDALAIFYDDQLLKRNSTFRQQNNRLNYEVYQISKMKKNLDQQIEPQKFLFKSVQQSQYKPVQQQQVQVVQPQQQIQNNQYDQQQLKLSLSDLIQKKEKELEDLKLRVQSIINPSESAQFFFSEAKVMKSLCAFCQHEIEEEKLQTFCYHDFHPLCFKFMVEAQIQSKSFIQCICNKRLSLKMLNQLKDPAEINYLLTKAYQNQLVQIQKNTMFKQLKLIKCSGKNCQCLYITTDNNILLNCPYCKN